MHTCNRCPLTHGSALLTTTAVFLLIFLWLPMHITFHMDTALACQSHTMVRKTLGWLNSFAVIAIHALHPNTANVVLTLLFTSSTSTDVAMTLRI